MFRKIRTGFYHVFIIAFGAIMLYPLLWMISGSFKDTIEIFQGTNFFPKAFNVANYVKGWKGLSGYTFTRFYANSFFVVAIAILGNLASCLLVANAFAKLKFPLKNFWFALMMGTLMLPMHVKLIPQYILYNHFGWVNTYLPILVPKFLATDGFFIFLMTQFMRGLPKEIDEAATVDGCGVWKMFTRITVPLSTPAIVTTAIFTFIWTWNDFFSQMIYVSDIKLYTVSLALRQFVDATGNSSWGALFAMSTISLIPLFLMFVFFQNYLVEGITAGSVKG
jgi:multiple sugar transport system permease protein